jgi:hypothetical protein
MVKKHCQNDFVLILVQNLNMLSVISTVLSLLSMVSQRQETSTSEEENPSSDCADMDDDVGVESFPEASTEPAERKDVSS